MVSKKVVRSPRKVAVQGYSSLFLFFGGVPMSMKEIVLISLIGDFLVSTFFRMV